MDARIGFPNEHLAGDSEDALSSPSYATAVGLLMEGLDRDAREEEDIIEEVTQEGTGISENDTAIMDEKPKPKKKKSFFDKFTESLKDFLDNAE
jgi:cell division protein FtsA